jgi:hypothetical protein
MDYYEYKVLSFSNDKFKMEDNINKLAEEGWRVNNMCLLHPDSSKYTIVVTLERKKQNIKND